LDKQDQVDLVDTTYPTGRNDALQWNIQSKISGKVPVEIRYFTSGLTWSADYVGIANEDETKLNVTGYVRVTNHSGELYDNAQTRLVVGKINLVEKIAALARKPPPTSPRRAGGRGGRGGGGGAGFGQQADEMARQLAEYDRLNENGALGINGGVLLESQKEVGKEALSEYFLFTIEGREDIKDNEPKRLVALKVAEVPLECVYKLIDRTAIVVPALPPELARQIPPEPVFDSLNSGSIRFLPGANSEDAERLRNMLLRDSTIHSPLRVNVGKDGLYISSPDVKTLDVVERALTRSGQITKYYRFKNVKLLDDKGKEKKLSGMENLGLSPLPNGMVKLFSEYKNKDLAYVGGTATKYVPIGDRVEVNVGPDKDITIQRRVKDQKVSNVVARQYKRRIDDQFVEYYDLIDYDETFFYEEELVSGKPVPAKVEVERQFDADVVLWGSEGEPKGWSSNEPGAYVDLHTVAGRVERVDQQHAKYFMDLPPGKKQVVQYSVTYKRRKVGPDLNTERKREPL
jgi:hypothetical protein